MGHPRWWLFWLIPAVVAIGFALFVRSEIDGMGSPQPAAVIDDVPLPPPTPLECAEGDTGTQATFDYAVVDRDRWRDPGTPRAAVARQLLGPSGRLRGATLDEFVAGPASASRAEERLVRDGRVVAVASLTLEDGVGWIVTSLASCVSLLDAG